MKGSAIVFLATGVVVAAGLLTAGCEGNGHEHQGDHEEMESAPAEEIAQKSCPVMGNPINPDIYVDHEGRRVYFCCQACVAKFKADPEKYLAKLDSPWKGTPAAAEQDTGK
jgi:YHS domain-containing protein